MRLTPRLLTLAAFAVAALLSVLAASWAALVVESRSASAVTAALESGGYGWAEVGTDGLQVTLTGTAPSEAARFRALSIAGEGVDPSRVIDGMDVAEPDNVAPPDFSVEILRNSDGISLIGLVPDATDRTSLVGRLAPLVASGSVTDMLNAADHPVPETWGAALEFGVAALERLPRSKISVTAGRVEVTAISDSASERARIETELARIAPDGVEVALDISAPRPVIAPFALRFLIDDRSARFDACSADTEAARDAILAAAVEAGAERKLTCTIGLGAPSPAWGEAASAAIRALGVLGAGTVTFSDADVSLVAAAGVPQADFDRVVGELDAALPEVFALKATLTPAETDAAAAPPEFSAVLAGDGRVQLRGRISDERMRLAVENFARARFGTQSVQPAMRVDETLPAGWPLRVLAGLEALAEVDEGSVLVQPESIRIQGVTGSQDAAATVSRMLADRLGPSAKLDIAISYDPERDPLNSLPTPEECVRDLNAILAEAKIAFEPGSVTIAPSAVGTLDRLAETMKDCSEVPMEVSGHTDSQGREEMNLGLSQGRAEAVVAALMERRILTGNLVAKGYGEIEPLASNETEEGREANRRIEFRLVGAEEAAADEAAVDGEVEIVVQTPDDDTARPRPRPQQ
jgi:OOP family OmpA-OmpF porin